MPHKVDISSSMIYGSMIPIFKYLGKDRVYDAKLSKEAKRRLRIIDFYYTKANRNASLTCRHFCISRSYFYKWKNRFNPKYLGTVNDAARTNKTAAFGSVAPGDNGTAQTTSAMTISCNTAWQVTPSSEGLKATDKTTITSAENAKGSWFKVQLVAGNTEGTNGGTINNPFSTAATIDGTTKVTGTAAAQDLTLTPTYSLHIGNNQEQGTYSGDVTYTIALGA